MDDKKKTLRKIPQVEKLIQHEEIREFIPKIGHSIVASIVKMSVDSFRKAVEKGKECNIDDLTGEIVRLCNNRRLRKLQPVINGTGVIIHTNLGRSPLSECLIERLKDIAGGYCNLEFDLVSQKRGKRGGFAEELICHLTGADDALIVNNNASSVFLILKEFAAGREVIVSRGELIQIGGGFRLPDIMESSGARLVEVGTTNITDLDDFRKAVTDETSMIFSSHWSNFSIEGFTRRPSLKELSSLKSDSIIFIRDLGSGNLVSDQRLPGDFEKTIAYELSQGPDLICFSGDKLLGACQAGIIIGRRDLVNRLRKNPLMRMIRVDKIIYFLLQETFLSYINREIDNIALWNIIFQTKKEISARIARFMRAVKSEKQSEYITKIETRATYGGGSMPTAEIESAGIEISIPGITADKLYAMLASAPVPIIGSIVDDRYRIDFLTILDRNIPDLASALDYCIASGGD